MMELKKRQEHGPRSYGVYVDLVKAFDTATREALLGVLRKSGMPDHFVKMLLRLHAGEVTNVKISGKDTAVESSIDVL